VDAARVLSVRIDFRGDTVMQIDSLKDGVFEPEATALMGEAFDAACEQFPALKHKWTRELIATRIIAAARRGVLDPGRLRSFALVETSNTMTLTAS
jgi:hypothetical protein